MRFLRLAWKHHTWLLLALLLVVARYREPQLAPPLFALPVAFPSIYDKPDLDYLARSDGAFVHAVGSVPRNIKRREPDRLIQRPSA